MGRFISSPDHATLPMDRTLDGLNPQVAYHHALESEQKSFAAREETLVAITAVYFYLFPGAFTPVTLSNGEQRTLEQKLEQDPNNENAEALVEKYREYTEAFPDDAEPPRVERSQHGFYVISIAIAAQLPPEDLFELSERVRRELLIMPGVSEINLRGRLAPQISIEIGEDRLRALTAGCTQDQDSSLSATEDYP